MHITTRRGFCRSVSAGLCALMTRRLWAQSAATQPAASQPAAHEIAAGPFKPDWDSLASQYQCPDWFRDAKFGIWAHWSAQCVPEQGDWYARHMYMQGHPHYAHHLKNYGHPTTSGFMEIDNLWKAEKWDPEYLMGLYKAAGAKYFFALANHHDNFDCYDSTYHAWNSVNIGPKKDIIGTWAKVAREAGLRFGVTNHCSHAWHWFQTAYGYDATGDLAGKRYDAFTLTKADGKGKWWEGLDPQDLYTGPNIVIPDGFTDIKKMNGWHGLHDGHWYEEAPNCPKFVENWFLRCKELIDKYQPDQIYFDDTGLPFGQVGLEIAAHLYNSSIARSGKLEAVINGKNLPQAHRAALVEDLERGVSNDIRPAPWQTDTCIGDWHYSRTIYDHHWYKSVDTVTRMLVDIVSKNGNLMLNIPVRGDGSIDDDEVKFLKNLAIWMNAEGEGIFGSRPWCVSGEGPAHQVAGGGFNEGKLKYTAEDIRFTTKDGALYAYTLGAPTQPVVVRSLASDSKMTQPVAAVALLGSAEPLKWSQDQAGLTIQPPQALPVDGVVGFKIQFKG